MDRQSPRHYRRVIRGLLILAPLAWIDASAAADEGQGLPSAVASVQENILSRDAPSEGGDESPRRAPFGWINYAALIGYLALMLAVGCRFSARNKSTNDYFRGGQRVPWWAAGLSIYATVLSSITYMAIPAKAFATDWSFFFNTLSFPLMAPVIVLVYLPFFRKLDVTSAYEYLEKRFNLVVRWFGSLSFVSFQIGRMAIVLYLPALALATVSSLDVFACILLMSVLCIVYTMLGGIEAVVWTEVIQAIVLLVGALAALVVLVWQCEGGPIGVIQTAHAYGKFFERVDWSWNLTAGTAWVVLLGSMISQLVPYTASQDVVQRYLTTKDARQAARSIWTNALIVVPSGALFFALGTALFVFYRQHPERLDPTLPTDAVFPQFIVGQLPVGIAGLLIAGIFAASQSTVSSGLNSVATCLVTDFYRRLKPDAADRTCLRLARILTLAVGVLVTAAACAMACLDIASLWDGFLTVLGLTGGALAGLFALGIFSTRANGFGALCGALGSVLVLLCVQQYTDIHFFLYAGIGIVACFTIGWAASLLCGRKPDNLAGLTRATVNQPRPDSRRRLILQGILSDSEDSSLRSE